MPHPSSSGSSGSKRAKALAADLIALGSQQSSSNSNAASSSSSGASGASNVSGSKDKSSKGLKRDAREAPSATTIPIKKPKFAASSSATSSSVTATIGQSSSGGSTNSGASSRRSSDATWKDVTLISLEPHDIVPFIQEAEAANDMERIESILVSSVKLLKSNRLKIDQLLALSLMFFAKNKPSLFQSECVVEAFISILKRDTSSAHPIKVKLSNALPVLAANLVYSFLKDEANWPKSLIAVYVQDSLNERLWVDSCKPLSDNLIASFSTKVPPKTSTATVMSLNPAIMKSEVTRELNNSPTHDDSNSMDSSAGGLSSLKDSVEDEAPSVYPRFSHLKNYPVDYINQVINEYLNRRPVCNEKNIIKFLTTATGMQAIRLIAASKVDAWLQNPKLAKSALELFWCLIWNSTGDAETFAALVKIRFKQKAHINHFVSCVKEFLNQSDENISLILRQAVMNEILCGPLKGSQNMQLISVCFQNAPEKSTKVLATLFQELISKDDYLKSLRGLLRDIVRALRYDYLNMTLFVATLVELDNTCNLDLVDANNSSQKERIFSSIIDLITLCMFLSISPSIKEAASFSKSDRKDIMRSFQIQVCEMQRSGVYWIQKASQRLSPEKADFTHGLNKVLLMEPMDTYSCKDNWPPESERQLIIRLSSEVPLLEDTLVRLLQMGLSSSFPIYPMEVIELTDSLIRRAASIFETESSRSYPVLQMRNEELFTLLLRSATYRMPDNITLPADYEPPELAVSDWYWKAWTQLLILTSHNINYFGKLAWESYPTLAIMIEMAITNTFEFPPSTSSMTDDLMADEIAMLAVERQQVLKFESHLAAATSKTQITEANSLLLSKVITLDPKGIARKPPPNVLESLRNLNHSLKLGHLLCQSRCPDFLLQIIQRQQQNTTGLGGTLISQAPVSMPWLNQLVELHEDNYSSLPIQCLCEFLMGQLHDEKMSAPANAPATGYMGDGKKGSVLGVQSNSAVNILNSSVTGNFGGIPSSPSTASSALGALGNTGGSGKQSDKVKEKERKRKLKKLINYFSSILLTPVNSGKNNNTTSNNGQSSAPVEVGTFYPATSFLSSTTASAVNVQLSRELLDYFMKRLASQSSHLRSLSIKALNLILTPSEQLAPTPSVSTDSQSNQVQPPPQQQQQQQSNGQQNSHASLRLNVNSLSDDVTFLLDDDFDDEESSSAQAFPLHKGVVTSSLKSESIASTPPPVPPPPSVNNQQSSVNSQCLALGNMTHVTFDFLDSLVNCTRNFNLGLKETACESLRWALVVETNPYAICRYTQFLAQNSIGDGDNQLAETSANLASLLIDRSAVVRILTADDSQYRVSFLTSCYQIFHAYLNSLEKASASKVGKSASRNQEELDNAVNLWVNDQIDFEWDTVDGRKSNKLRINITVVHAMIILLTYGTFSGIESLYQSLMSTWFCDPPPTCYLPNSHEEAVFLPDWLRLRMLRSNNTALVDAAMKDLDSVQLVLFIQSFGLPVKSMQRLLAALDESCDEDEGTVRECIPDEKFMKHLLQVQWMRGAQAGFKFASMLGLQANG